MGRMPDCACLISVASIRAVTGSVFMPRFGLSLGQCVSHAEEGNIIAYPPIYRLLCGVTSICYPHCDKLVQILRHLCRFATKKLFLLFFLINLHEKYVFQLIMYIYLYINTNKWARTVFNRN